MSAWNATITTDFTLFCVPKKGWPSDQKIEIASNRYDKPRITLLASNGDQGRKEDVLVALSASEARILVAQLSAAIAIAEEPPDA